MRPGPWCAAALALVGPVTPVAPGAWGADAEIPSGAPNCNLAAPPVEAGAYVTPGGFLLVYPRNASLPGGYTGCKSLWLLDDPDRPSLYLRLYFERGSLRFARVYDRKGKISASCDLRSPEETCRGMADNPLAALRTPTWPRACVENPDLPSCSGEPD